MGPNLDVMTLCVAGNMIAGVVFWERAIPHTSAPTSLRGVNGGLAGKAGHIGHADTTTTHLGDLPFSAGITDPPDLDVLA